MARRTRHRPLARVPILRGMRQAVEHALGHALSEAQWEHVLDLAVAQAIADGRLTTRHLCDEWYVLRYVFAQDATVTDQPAVQRFIAEVRDQQAQEHWPTLTQLEREYGHA